MQSSSGSGFESHPFGDDQGDDEGGGGDEEGQSVAEDVERESSMVAGVENDHQSSVEQVPLQS